MNERRGTAEYENYVGEQHRAKTRIYETSSATSTNPKIFAVWRQPGKSVAKEGTTVWYHLAFLLPLYRKLTRNQILSEAESSCVFKCAYANAWKSSERHNENGTRKRKYRIKLMGKNFLRP